MKTQDILQKAWLKPAYVASDDFFADCETVVLDIEALLEIYTLWQYWYYKTKVVYLRFDERWSQNQEEFETKQKKQMQYFFLDQKFLPKLAKLLEGKQMSLIDYAQTLMQQKNVSVRTLMLLLGILQLPYHRRNEKLENVSLQLVEYLAKLG